MFRQESILLGKVKFIKIAIDLKKKNWRIKVGKGVDMDLDRGVIKKSKVKLGWMKGRVWIESWIWWRVIRFEWIGTLRMIYIYDLVLWDNIPECP